MIAHLNVPSTIRPISRLLYSNRSSRIYYSREITLQWSLFHGRHEHEGVTKGRTPGEADVEALPAGNDILLFPENVEASVRKIKAAIRKGVSLGRNDQRKMPESP